MFLKAKIESTRLPLHKRNKNRLDIVSDNRSKQSEKRKRRPACRSFRAQSPGAERVGPMRGHALCHQVARHGHDSRTRFKRSGTLSPIILSLIQAGREAREGSGSRSERRGRKTAETPVEIALPRKR